MRHTRQVVKLLTALPHLALALLTLAGCGSESGPDPAPAPLAVFEAPAGEEYVVGYGETIHVGELTLEFAAVAEDTRCPFEASCLAGWIGNARILVDVSQGGAVGRLELNTHPDLPARAVFVAYGVELRILAPEIPRRLGPPEQYEATFRITRLTP
jgi:hypothetical protein